jgi:hypothetical protein
MPTSDERLSRPMHTQIANGSHRPLMFAIGDDDRHVAGYPTAHPTVTTGRGRR